LRLCEFGLVCFAILLVSLGFFGKEHWAASDAVRFVLLGWLEGDIVAEAWGFHHHQVGAREGFLDQSDAIGTD
jgi:hypothetical protein